MVVRTGPPWYLRWLERPTRVRGVVGLSPTSGGTFPPGFSTMSVVTVLFLTASLLGLLFSDMVRVVDCHVGVLGSNPGGPKRFPLGITSLVAAVIGKRLSRPLGAVAGC